LLGSVEVRAVRGVRPGLRNNALMSNNYALISHLLCAKLRLT